MKTYRYTNLDSVADYFANKAKEQRAWIGRPGQRKKDDEARLVRAAAYEEVALMLRDMELVEA